MQKVRDNLFLIDLDQPLEGYRQCISAWVCTIEGATIVVDPGPPTTIPHLARELKEAGFDKVDYLLLTHIHIDHGGGAGHFVQHFPDAKVNCHPKGIPHLVAPQKLWEESKKVLGQVAEAYGEIAPVPASSVSWREEIRIGTTTIEAVETPGHSAHHVSYRVGDVLFAGELVGVYVPLENGLYCRPATPPPFVHRAFQDSLSKAAALDVSLVCLGHYGARSDVAAVFERAGRQLDLWLDAVHRHLRMRSDPFEEVVLADLIASDPSMAGWALLPKDIQARERGFCFNSIRGIRGYLEKIEADRARS